MGLRILWLRRHYLHVSLAEVDSIPEHSARKLLVEVGVRSLGVLCTSVIRDVSCAEGLGEEDVIIIQELQLFLVFVLVIVVIDVGQGLLPLEATIADA